MIQLKRAYEKRSPTDGYRVLVERLWPRGLTKRRAAIDLWLKDVAPSPELRTWFAHDPAKWKRFEQRYWKELQNRQEVVELLRSKAKQTTITFIYAAKDEYHNGALALLDYFRYRWPARTGRLVLHPNRRRVESACRRRGGAWQKRMSFSQRSAS